MEGSFNRHSEGEMKCLNVTLCSLGCNYMKTSAKRRSSLGEVIWFDTRGAELLEMAIILPVLLTVLIGIFWFARAYNIYETITRAAREGVRAAVVPSCATCGNNFLAGSGNGYCGTANPPPSDGIDGAISSSLSASSLDPCSAGAVITVNQHQKLNLDPNNPNAEWTVVSITYPFKFNLPFTSLNLTSVPISTQVQMLEEQ